MTRGYGPLIATVTFVVAFFLVLLLTNPAEEVPCQPVFPPCPYEDGSPSGQPCLWTDPDTGLQYFIDSSEYLD